MFDVFKNGSAKINRRLVIIECAMGCALMVIVGVQGLLPSQSWLSQHSKEAIGFGLAIIGLVFKGIEMFFSKTAAMYRDAHDTDFFPKPPEPPTQKDTSNDQKSPSTS